MMTSADQPILHNPAQAGCRSYRGACADFRGKPALFLDRDGVIVDETHYLHRADDGYYDWDAFEAVQAHIEAYHEGRGAHFDMVCACAYHAQGAGQVTRRAC